MWGESSPVRYAIVAQLWPDFLAMVWLTARMARQPKPQLHETDLGRWKLVARFHQQLHQVAHQQGLAPTWCEPQRLLQLGDYLGLFLFGLLNPVVRTLRGLSAASRLQRVQQQVCTAAVSLGSFSEAQHLVEPELLQQVFTQLSGELAAGRADPQLGQLPWQIVDSTLWAALPRMLWAVYGGGKAGAVNPAVRLHLGFHLLGDKPVQATVTAGKRCERAVWAANWQAGAAYVGDRNYGQDYELLEQLQQRGCWYVVRLRDNAVLGVQRELTVTAADRAAGVVRHAWVELGGRGAQQRAPVRVVWIENAGVKLQVVTNVAEQTLAAELVALVYRQRWQVELFFRWIKCVLGVRHWLAESAPGVSVQVYLALIAAVLLQLYTGQRPSRRMMEMLQMYLLGWAGEEEVTAALARELARQKSRL